ncbi:hypothetical protein DFH28DRAFT_1140590 [Melampsora americana]|nr:hypothetical protein DFH28DRAFT_1140590 [Melampsora americana]
MAKQRSSNRSTSSRAAQKRARKERKRFQPNYYPPNHAKRPNLRASTFNILRQAISDKLGVPSDCRLYFLKKHEMHNLPETARIQIHLGNSVILDADTWKVIQVNRFLPFSEMTQAKKNELDFVISKIYEHTLARSEVTICGSTQGRTFGVTAFHPKVGRNEDLILEDQNRMLEMASINEILADYMASLCLKAFQSNRQLAINYSIPSFADTTWSESPNANVVGSSIVCTRDGFNNNPHRDKDASQYAHGLYARINRTTGQLHSVAESDHLGDIVGCKFILDEYHYEVVLDSCDGVIESCWASDELHHTSESTAYDEGWVPIPHRDSPITRFGCSLQINKALVKRIKVLLKLKEGKTQADWEDYKKRVVKCYEQEVAVKLDKIHKTQSNYQRNKIGNLVNKCY